MKEFWVWPKKSESMHFCGFLGVFWSKIQKIIEKSFFNEFLKFKRLWSNCIKRTKKVLINIFVWVHLVWNFWIRNFHKIGVLWVHRKPPKKCFLSKISSWSLVGRLNCTIHRKKTELLGNWGPRVNGSIFNFLIFGPNIGWKKSKCSSSNLHDFGFNL